MVKWEVVSLNRESSIPVIFDLKHIKCGGGLGGGGVQIILGIKNKIYFCLEKQ